MNNYRHPVNGTPVPIYFPEHEDDLEGLRAFVERTPVIALDTETTGLKIYGSGFACRLVQLGSETEAWVLRADRFAPIIREILARPDRRFVCHNAPFDLLVLDRCGLAPLEVLGPRTFDTYVLAHLCDPRTENDGGPGLGLKPLSTIYVDPDAADTSKALYEIFRREYRATKATGWALIDIDHPLYVTYAGLDVIYTARLLRELSTLIRQTGLSDLAQFEHRVQLITAHQQRRGLRIDVPYTEGLVADLAAEADHFRTVAAGYGVENVNSTRQVIAALEGMGEVWSERTATGNPAVGKDVLLPMADLDRDWNRLGIRDEANPLADAIVRSKRADKWRESYAQPFLDDRDEGDRIHPFIKSLAARTARMSVSNPPLQQLPSSDWTIRRCVVADPGHLIVAADYAAVEMRVLAALADVSRMKELISAGADLHTETARLVYGQEWELADAKAQKKMRGLMKGVGFGKVYGGGPTGLARQTGLPYAQVKHATDGYDAVYPEVSRWGRQLQRQASYGGGAVVTPIGRRLPLDRDRAYAATNYVVQSTARDVLARALCRIDDAGLSGHVLLPVHDELVCQFPEAEAEEGIREIGRLMETELRGVHIASDPEVYGPTWGHGYGAPE